MFSPGLHQHQPHTQKTDILKTKNNKYILKLKNNINGKGPAFERRLLSDFIPRQEKEGLTDTPCLRAAGHLSPFCFFSGCGSALILAILLPWSLSFLTAKFAAINAQAYTCAMCTCMHTLCYSTFLEVRKQFCGVGSLSPPTREVQDPAQFRPEVRALTHWTISQTQFGKQRKQNTNIICIHLSLCCFQFF